MSEEEIIDIVKEIKSHQVAFYEPKEHKQILKNYFTQEQRDAIQGLLDLYQAEKEKNKELEIESLDKNIWKNKYIEQVKYGNKVTLDGDAVPQVIDIIKKNYISKDKINSKIAEYEEILQSSIIKEDYKLEVQHIIGVLKELKGDN